MAHTDHHTRGKDDDFLSTPGLRAVCAALCGVLARSQNHALESVCVCPEVLPFSRCISQPLNEVSPGSCTEEPMCLLTAVGREL